MYHIVAEAKVRDAQRVARQWADECAGHVIRPNNQSNRIRQIIQRFAALAMSFLA